MATIAHKKAHEAIALLQKGLRDEAAQALEIGLRAGPPNGPFWKSFATLADRIGEIDIAVEAMRRFSRTQPMLLSRYLLYWGMLAKFGRESVALEEVRHLPDAARNHPSTLNFRGQMAAQAGDFEGARALYRRVIDGSGFSPQTWFALSAITNFSDQRPLLDRMVKLLPQLDLADKDGAARYHYALARGYHDLRDFESAFRHYSTGASIRRANEKYNPDEMARNTDRLIEQFSAESLSELTPPSYRLDQAIFVTGLPRSGTTLMQQILCANDRVSEGGEVSLLQPALIPTGKHLMPDALHYQRTCTDEDPWGKIARQYARTLKMRFGTDKRVVDKTLMHSHLMGLLLHTLPDCPVIWMRRSPDDVAISCFRNYFSGSLPWTWSLAEIGHFMALEDRLFAHWTSEFPDRILAVPYEGLVDNPRHWIARVCAHTGLEQQESMEHFYLSRAAVKTASLQQVRRPIGKDRIGLSSAYDPWMGEFWDAYQPA